MIGDIFEKSTLKMAKIVDNISVFILSDQFASNPITGDTFATLATCVVN